jgi:hypothetical protein
MAELPEAIRGLIVVPMSLKEELSVQECDDWYNNEHVPIRMRLPYFDRGYRYRSIEQHNRDPPASGLSEWLAIYDISNLWDLTKEEYQQLLTPNVQSLRESKIIQKLAASRKYYDLVSTYEAADYLSLEDSLCRGGFEKVEGTLIVVGVNLINNSVEAEEEWNR